MKVFQIVIKKSAAVASLREPLKNELCMKTKFLIDSKL